MDPHCRYSTSNGGTSNGERRPRCIKPMLRSHITGSGWYAMPGSGPHIRVACRAAPPPGSPPKPPRAKLLQQSIIPPVGRQIRVNPFVGTPDAGIILSALHPPRPCVCAPFRNLFKQHQASKLRQHWPLSNRHVDAWSKGHRVCGASGHLDHNTLQRGKEAYLCRRWQDLILAISAVCCPSLATGVTRAASRRPEVYIEKFLARFRHDIRGHVIEVGDDVYTRRFGETRVTLPGGGAGRATAQGTLPSASEAPGGPRILFEVSSSREHCYAHCLQDRQ